MAQDVRLLGETSQRNASYDHHNNSCWTTLSAGLLYSSCVLPLKFRKHRKNLSVTRVSLGGDKVLDYCYLKFSLDYTNDDENDIKERGLGGQRVHERKIYKCN